MCILGITSSPKGDIPLFPWGVFSRAELRNSELCSRTLQQDCDSLPAGVWVELLALSQTRLRALPALTQAGVWVEWLIPGTLCSADAATQLLVPPLAGGAQLPLTLTFTLAFT